MSEVEEKNWNYRDSATDNHEFQIFNEQRAEARCYCFSNKQRQKNKNE